MNNKNYIRFLNLRYPVHKNGEVLFFFVYQFQFSDQFEHPVLLTTLDTFTI